MEFSVPVGTIVHWRPFGNWSQDPFAAIVTKTSSSGVLGLALVPDATRDLIPKRGVWFINDPHLVERPQLAKETGGWSFIPGTEPVVTVAKAGEAIADPESELSDYAKKEDRIMHWAAKGKKAAEIARYVGLKTADVEKVIQDNSVET